MKIIRARHMGMCFGVRDAIDLALGQAEPLTIWGDLVHNERVLERLRARGVAIEEEAERVGTEAVMITAHGASDRTKAALRGRGHRVLEATCPLVHYAHHAMRKLVAAGYFPVVIGQRGHVEVRGLTGDVEAFEVVLTEADIERLAPRARFGVVAQTTQPIDRVRHLVRRLRARFPESEVRFLDTVCQPTKQRQESAVALARHCDLVIVVGGAHSNNTRELANTCRRHCGRVYHVQGPDDLRAEWLEAVETAGVTAGTSTPDELIGAVEARLRELAGTGESVPAAVLSMAKA